MNNIIKARSKATLIGSVSILLWGMLAFFTQMTEGRIPPFQMMAITFSIAFLVMALRWWLKGNLGLKHLRQPLCVWLLGIGCFFGYHFCYFLAMQSAPTVDVSLIAYLWPLLIVLFSAFLPDETLKLKQVIGSVCALFGCWLIVSRKSDPSTGFNTEFIQGYLLAFACAIIWSGYSVLSRFNKQVPTDVVGWYCFFTAILAWFAHFYWEETVQPETLKHWVGLFCLGVGPMGVAFFTWDYGVKRGDLPLLGVLSYFTPLISVVVLILWGDALLSINLILACIAIVIGSLIAGLSFKSVKSVALNILNSK